MKARRVLVLVHEDLVPPDSLDGYTEAEISQWQTEYDVVSTLRAIGHEVMVVGVYDDLGRIRQAMREFKPHITFNLLEEFHGNSLFDHHVASFLELMKQPYTGCNPRGLMLSHDKALTKKILSFHRIRVPRFAVLPHGYQARALHRLSFPLIVKSQIEEGSYGISQASIVRNEDKLRERVGYVRNKLNTPVIVEEYIEGRELYIPILGNTRLHVMPIIELHFGDVAPGTARIATSRLKWDAKYQSDRNVSISNAWNLDEALERQLMHVGKRIYRALGLSGYARIDVRLTEDNEIFVLEANPNPDISRDGEFALAAEAEDLSYEALLQKIITLGGNYRGGLALS
ncbi:MAG: ATP-grasp domain-containing protein [Gammaproteobacteria bacterium]|nr:ATP-grasp domain-containing protein [Gammaproteobacteria bacterium]